MAQDAFVAQALHVLQDDGPDGLSGTTAGPWGQKV